MYDEWDHRSDTRWEVTVSWTEYRTVVVTPEDVEQERPDWYHMPRVDLDALVCQAALDNLANDRDGDCIAGMSESGKDARIGRRVNVPFAVGEKVRNRHTGNVVRVRAKGHWSPGIWARVEE